MMVLLERSKGLWNFKYCAEALVGDCRYKPTDKSTFSLRVSVQAPYLKIKKKNEKKNLKYLVRLKNLGRQSCLCIYRYYTDHLDPVSDSNVNVVVVKASVGDVAKAFPVSGASGSARFSAIVTSSVSSETASD